MTSEDIGMAISLLWSKNYSTEDSAIHSSEFLNLCNVCQVNYCGAGTNYFVKSDFDNSQLFNEVRNMFRTHGAPWFEGTVLDVAAMSSHFEKSFTDEEDQRLDLVPLDIADDLPNIQFGEFELRRFSEESLIDLVNLPRLTRFGAQTYFDVSKLAQFTWLIFRHSEKRQLPIRSRTFLHSLDLNEVGRVRHRTRRFSAQMELGMFVLTLLPWEDATTNTFWTWQPFKFPWAYSVSNDPFVNPGKGPDPDTLTWEWRLTSKGEEYRAPLQNTLDDVNKLDLDQLNNLLQMARTVLSQSRQGQGCFNVLAEHYFLRAFEEDGLDQLLWHVATLDAVLGSGDKKSLARRIGHLTNDSALQEEFNELYDRRSEYVHGRAIDDSNLWQKNLAAARRVTRKVIVAIMTLAHANQNWNRRELLKHLD